MSGNGKPRVLFFSQQRLLRESLAANLGQAADIEFLPPVSTLDEAIHSVQTLKPSSILIDLNPALFGLKVARELRSACPECSLIVLMSHDDAVAQEQLAVAGVRGVLTKNISIDELIQATREISSGKTVFVKDGHVLAERPPVKTSGLTDREAQVLELVAKGLANKQIAAELGISIKTVEKHRQRVMCKLNAHETAGLTWRAICMGVARGTAAYPFLSS